jgi:hypothetical protein
MYESRLHTSDSKVLSLKIVTKFTAAFQSCAAALNLGLAGLCGATAAMCELAALIQHQAAPAGELHLASNLTCSLHNMHF